MDRKDLEYIQTKINYRFSNWQLLQQAFIRRSYSKENPQWQDNEVLEFIGDSELDSFIVRKLYTEFGSISKSDNQFYSKKKEGELTKLKAQYVEKESLAHCIELLDFNKYLIMGNSDTHNNVQNNLSVKEDLFEAIVGAVALDSDFKRDAIDTVCTSMLGYVNFDDDYVEIVKEWCKEHNYREPRYLLSFWTNSVHIQNYPISNNLSPVFDIRNTKASDGAYKCTIQTYCINPAEIISKEGRGETKELAMMDAAESLYYDYCEILDMKAAVGEPDKELAINQLHELAQKEFFDEPEFSYEQEYDEDGCPVWKCDCNIADYEDPYNARASTKKEAKRKAAYKALSDILDMPK